MAFGGLRLSKKQVTNFKNPDENEITGSIRIQTRLGFLNDTVFRHVGNILNSNNNLIINAAIFYTESEW